MSSSPTKSGSIVDVTMPQMGVSVAEGTVVEWKRAVGDTIEADEIICAISTDKIDTDVESPAGGVLAEIVVAVGETVEVGTVLARISTDGSALPESAAPAPEADVVAVEPDSPAEVQRPPEGAGANGSSAPAGGGRARRYSPVVMRIAAEHGIDLDTVTGTGRDGRVRKQDVLAVVEGGGGEEPPMHIESPYKPDEPVAPRRRASRIGGAEADVVAVEPDSPAKVQRPPAGGVYEVGPVQSGPLSRMRQSIGRAMISSLQTAATCTTVVEIDMSRVETARRKLGLTALPFVARATIDSLRDFPLLNATLEGETFTQYEHVHLGVAVSLGGGGLIVPVIHNAHELSVEGISARIKDIARRARDNELTPDEVRGATFTLTNPGSFGSILATPVINQPQVAILDTEAVVKRPVVVTDAQGNDSIAIRPMTYFCMSWDHRALDGVMAAQFLSKIRERLESLVV